MGGGGWQGPRTPRGHDLREEGSSLRFGLCSPLQGLVPSADLAGGQVRPGDGKDVCWRPGEPGSRPGHDSEALNLQRLPDPGSRKTLSGPSGKRGIVLSSQALLGLLG